ncbi:MAG: hypothetical protein AAFQ67_00225 [Pseudomonadota bacterium]
MKRAHRRNHFVIWLLMGPALAAIIYLALSVRPAPDALDNDALPDFLSEETA